MARDNERPVSLRARVIDAQIDHTGNVESPFSAGQLDVYKRQSQNTKLP